MNWSFNNLDYNGVSEVGYSGCQMWDHLMIILLSDLKSAKNQNSECKAKHSKRTDGLSGIASACLILVDGTPGKDCVAPDASVRWSS